MNKLRPISLSPDHKAEIGSFEYWRFRSLAWQGARATVVCGLGFMALALLVLACNIRSEGQFSIIERATLEHVNGPGRTNIDVGCLGGEQMVGGGYKWESLGSGQEQPPLIVEASYPHAINTWRLTVKSIVGENDPGSLVSGRAYCVQVSAIEHPLGMQIESNGA